MLTRRGMARARIRAGFVTGAVAALAAVGLVGPAVGATSAPPVAMADPETAADIPVLAQAQSLGTRDAGTPIVVSIHGVQRVEGGTIVYLSLGWPRNAENTDRYEASRSLGGSTYYFHSAVLGDGHCDTAVIDQQGAKAYLPLSYDDACSPVPRPELGQARVGAVLLAPLPPEVAVVDVSVHGTILTDVPVGDGELLPVATGDDAERYGPVLGMGWPSLDLSQIPASTDEYVIPLRQAVADLEGEITETATSIENSGDVLFEKNKYDLDAAGREVIARAVAQLKDKDPTGTTLVVVWFPPNRGGLPLSGSRGEGRGLVGDG